MAKLSHLPFEDWLLSGAVLSQEENRMLQEHLRGCAACQQLSAAWQAVENQLRTAPMLSPSPGFTDRWLARMTADRQKQHRRQTLLILIFSIGGVMLLLASFGLMVLPLLQSPKMLFWAWVYELLTLFTLFHSAQDALLVTVSTIADVVPLTWWLLFIGILSELAVLWIVTLRLLTNPRRITL